MYKHVWASHLYWPIWAKETGAKCRSSSCSRETIAFLEKIFLFYLHFFYSLPIFLILFPHLFFVCCVSTFFFSQCFAFLFLFFSFFSSFFSFFGQTVLGYFLLHCQGPV